MILGNCAAELSYNAKSGVNISSLSCRADILTPLRMIEISVRFIVKAIYKFESLCHYILRQRLGQIVTKVLRKSRGSHKPKRLSCALYIGKEALIISRTVSVVEAAVLGIVENMSYLKCPDCGREISVFGESHIEEVAQAHNLDVLARIPIDPKLAALCDKGMLELMENDYLETAADIIERRLEKKA